MNKRQVIGGILSAIGIILGIITGFMEREPLSIEHLIWILSGFIFGIGFFLLVFPSLVQRYKLVDIELSKEAIEELLQQQKEKEGNT